MASGPKPATCCSLAPSSPGALLSLKSLLISREHVRGALACAYDHHTKSTGVDKTRSGPSERYGTQYLGSSRRSKLHWLSRNMSRLYAKASGRHMRA
jgi:hypothetical protein